MQGFIVSFTIHHRFYCIVNFHVAQLFTIVPTPQLSPRNVSIQPVFYWLNTEINSNGTTRTPGRFGGTVTHMIYYA